MASVAYHHFNQFRSDGRVKLFEGSHGYANGEQRRDFIHVDDVIAANLHFWDKPRSGVYNLGTGRAQSFNDVALAVINTLRAAEGGAPLALAGAVSQRPDRVHRVSRRAARQVPGIHAGRRHATARRRLHRADADGRAGHGAYMRWLLETHERARPPRGRRAEASHERERAFFASVPSAGHEGLPVSGTRRAAFLDRDGVINVDHGYVVRQEEFEFVPGVLDAAAQLAAAGYALVVVTNQSGIGRGLYTAADFERLSDVDARAASPPPALRSRASYYCPHHPTDALGAFRRDVRLPQACPGHAAAGAARTRHRHGGFGAVRRPPFGSSGRRRRRGRDPRPAGQRRRRRADGRRPRGDGALPLAGRGGRQSVVARPARSGAPWLTRRLRAAPPAFESKVVARAALAARAARCRAPWC